MKMDYKSIVRSQSLRMRILKHFEWVPDSWMIRFQYRVKMGKKLNLKNPERYTEKIQWYKLFYRDPLMTQCADKHGVREYIKSIGYEQLLIPEIGCWESAFDIDWDKLPNSFVLKTTNGSETNLFINDKASANKDEINLKLQQWLTQTRKSAGREWAYDNIPPRIICEPILQADKQHGKGLDDYKFFCFDGVVAMMWIDYDRFVNHKRVLFKPDGTRIDVKCSYDSPKDLEFPKIEFETLLPIAKRISEPFPHARVDLYCVNQHPYFGEITFYSGSGYEPFGNDYYDFELGSHFKLPSPRP